jgi:hypothetical protein
MLKYDPNERDFFDQTFHTASVIISVADHNYL